jgi:general secretion pathway protein K
MRDISDSATESGFALLLVLIGLAVLSLVVAAAVEMSRHYGDEIALATETLRLRAASDAALATAARDLAEAGIVRPLLLSHPQAIELGGVHVTTSMRPETAKIDLNAADPALLRALMLASGFKRALSDRIADEIADWRDGDGEPRPHGAEAPDYLMAGRSYGPPNRDFESITELALLLHGGEDLAACLAPDVTVFSHQRAADPWSASARVRFALDAVTPRNGDTAQSAPQSPAGHTVSPGEMVELTVVAVGEGGRRYTRRATLRMTGDIKRPAWLVADMAPMPRDADVKAACRRASLVRAD